MHLCVALMKNLPDLLCQWQTAYSAIDCWLMVFIGLDDDVEERYLWWKALFLWGLSNIHTPVDASESSLVSILLKDITTNLLPVSPDFNPTERLWDQLGCAVRATVTNTTGRLVTNVSWRMRRHPTPACDQAGDHHEEEEVPGCCAFVYVLPHAAEASVC